jgi:hypothetical protein
MLLFWFERFDNETDQSILVLGDTHLSEPVAQEHDRFPHQFLRRGYAACYARFVNLCFFAVVLACFTHTIRLNCHDFSDSQSGKISITSSTLQFSVLHILMGDSILSELLLLTLSSISGIRKQNGSYIIFTSFSLLYPYLYIKL